jgi:hypothetical protein
VRGALIIVAFLGGACGHLCDTDKILAEIAGPDATACGDADGWSGSLADVRACAITAWLSRRPFWASSAPPSSDGGTTTGWASDGESLFVKVVDKYASGMGLAPDEQTIDGYRCTSIGVHGPCAEEDGYKDLCLICEGATTKIKLHCP